MAWIQDFSPQKPKTILFVSGDDRDAKAVVVGNLLIRLACFAPRPSALSADRRCDATARRPLYPLFELHFVRRIVR